MQSLAQAVSVFTNYGFLPKCCDATTLNIGCGVPALIRVISMFGHAAPSIA